MGQREYLASSPTWFFDLKSNITLIFFFLLLQKMPFRLLKKKKEEEDYEKKKRKKIDGIFKGRYSVYLL